MHGKDSPEIDAAAMDAEDYFETKGLGRGWTTHQVLWIEAQELVDKICLGHVAGCVPTPYKIVVSEEARPLKQIVKHELGHQGSYRLTKDVDGGHTRWGDFWTTEQWR